MLQVFDVSAPLEQLSDLCLNQAQASIEQDLRAARVAAAVTQASTDSVEAPTIASDAPVQPSDVMLETDDPLAAALDAFFQAGPFAVLLSSCPCLSCCVLSAACFCGCCFETIPVMKLFVVLSVSARR